MSWIFEYFLVSYVTMGQNSGSPVSTETADVHKFIPQTYSIAGSYPSLYMLMYFYTFILIANL